MLAFGKVPLPHRSCAGTCECPTLQPFLQEDEAPIPQELAEAEGHNPLLTKKDDLLLKPRRELETLGLLYRSRAKEVSPACAGLTLVSTLTIAACNAACFSGRVSPVQCCNAAALQEQPWGEHRSRLSCSFSRRQKNVERNTSFSPIPLKMLHGWCNDLLEIGHS